MKLNYRITQKGFVALILLLFFMSEVYSQDIHFTFANSKITNDGSNDFFETDVMIQTINSTGSFKLGSGQLYFTYNTLAFDDDVYDNSRFEVTTPHVEGYIGGQHINAAEATIYKEFTVNDNTSYRVSWSFSQAFAAATFTDNVTATPSKLCHIKFKFTDVNQDPMVAFETGDSYLDQFTTACGPDTGGSFESENCAVNPGIQLFNDTFDSGGATLSTLDQELIKGLSVYPIPTQELLYVDIAQKSDYQVIDMFGKTIIRGNLEPGENEIQMRNYQAGVYFLRIVNDLNIITKKIVIE
jgi:hypothetical protein